MSIRPGSRGREPTVANSSLEAPFVGRTAELETLLGALDEAVREGERRYVLVDGAAGIGKSRLSASSSPRLGRARRLRRSSKNASWGRGLSHPLGIALIGAGTTLLLAAMLPV